MAEFTPIESQEQFDEAIRDRLARANKKHEEETATLNEQIKTLQTEVETLNATLKDHEIKYADYDTQVQQIFDLQTKVANYEALSVKRDIADEFGLPKDLRDRIQGSNADEWRADAEKLAKFARPNQVAPLANPEGNPNEGDKLTAAFRKLSEGLSNQ